MCLSPRVEESKPEVNKPFVPEQQSRLFCICVLCFAFEYVFACVCICIRVVYNIWIYWEKCTIQMISGNRKMTKGLELLNQENIRTPGENETYKYSEKLEADTIKHVEMKEKKINQEFLRRTRKHLETKVNSRNFIKRINTLACPPCKILATILKVDKRRNWSGAENKKTFDDT